MIILIVVLCAAGGYFALSLTPDKAVRDDAQTIRTVVPLAELQADAQQQKSEELTTPAVDVSAPAGEAQSPALVNGDTSQSEQVVLQQAVSEKPVEPAAFPAPVATEALPAAASAPVAAEATAPVKAVPVSAEVVKPVETPAHVEPEALPASVPAAVEKPELKQSKPAPAEIAKPAVSAAPVKAPFYTVHVGSYRIKATASAEAERINAKGHDAFVEQADLGRRGTWYRVKVGRFKTKSEAEQLREKIHNVLVQDSVVVRNPKD
jgi:cell division protein FtsN